VQVAIIVAVLLVMFVTAVNDWQKERQFQRLQQSVSDTHMFSVVRNGQGREVNVREIVVGDVILVKYGDSIPADGLLLRCSDLQVDESAMTGESKLVRKEVPGPPLALSGTSVMQGGGKVLVTAVGSLPGRGHPDPAGGRGGGRGGEVGAARQAGQACQADSGRGRWCGVDHPRGAGDQAGHGGED
jgi:P-type E1-E2 ATPase